MARRLAFSHAAVLVLLFVPAGCATHAARVRDARELFYAGDLDAAGRRFAQEMARGKSGRDVTALDLAIVELVSGQPQQAERRLREIRDRFDHLEQTDAVESARSWLTDDTALSYAGEDYEKILIRCLLALASLISDGHDALAYSHQINAKQNQLIQAGVGGTADNPKLAYRPLALGPYLHGVLREAGHADHDDVQRAYAQVVFWEPAFRAAPTDLERARFGRHSTPGHGALYVFALVGRGPHKVETVELPTSNALLIADRILSLVGEYSLPPTIAPIKVPQLAVAPNRVAAVQVTVDGQWHGQTETITDVSRLALEQYNAVYPHIVGRAVARRVVKKAAVYAVKDHLDVNPWVSLALDAAGVAWEAAERADTRCWGLLPDKIQVVRLELPAGRHTVALSPASYSPIAGAPYSADVLIEDGRNTYMLAYFPDRHLTGQILVSGSDDVRQLAANGVSKRLP